VSADELRQSIVVERGLALEAAGLLVGATAEELEASADKLVRLIEERRREEEPATAIDPITAAIAGKQEQKRRLANLILGRPQPQPHDLDPGRR
jgi:hypothetical protein